MPISTRKSRRLAPIAAMSCTWVLACAAQAENAGTLEETAGWILDAPPFAPPVGKPTSSGAAASWKPGQPVPPSVLTQLLKRLPETDRLPANVLWHERQGQIGNMVDQLSPKESSPWLVLARIEAVLAAKNKPDDKQMAALATDLDAVGAKEQGVELAACFAAKGALLREAGKYPEMAQNMNFARRTLAAAAARDTSGTLKKSWKYRVVELRLAKLRPPVAGPAEPSPLEQAANWVLASPPLAVNAKPDSAPWKPGHAISPATLAQLKQHVPQADRLPLTALWWEHQGHLAQAEPLLRMDAKEKESIHAAWIEVARTEAVFSKKDADEKEVAAAVESLGKWAAQTKGVDQAACFAAQAHAQVLEEQYADAKQSLQSAKRILKPLAGKQADWRCRVVEARAAKLEKTVAEALTPAADKLFAQGQEARKRKAWVEAAKKFHALFTQCGDSSLAPEAGYLAGVCQIEAGDGKGGENELKNFIEKEPQGAWRGQAWLVLAERALWERHDPKEALLGYAAIAETQSTDKTWLEVLDTALLRKGACLWLQSAGKPCDAAAQCFSKYLARHPHSLLMERLGVKNVPNSTEELVKVARSGQNPFDAHPSVLASQKPGATLRLWMANCELMAERVEVARPLLMQILQLPEVAATHSQRAYAACEIAESYRMAGDSETALKQLKGVVEKFPRDEIAAWAHLQMGYLLANNNIEEAQKELLVVSQQFPQSSDASMALYVRGWIFHAQSKIHESRRTFQQLLSQYPNNPETKKFRESILYSDLFSSKP